MISVVIPVLNESPTVASVVAFARRDPRVAEVIVVDDGSIDGTPERARAAGATVITSTLLGKGASMEDGLRVAGQELVLYLDGDLSGLHVDLVDRMARPLLEHRADFVKARFTRSAGRVTTLTARPLLRTFFPELAGIEQPLGGIVAARRSLLRRLKFEPDYGVDVALLIDAAMRGARLAEADIGHIQHDSHPLEVLGDMAVQVARAVLDRAARYRRLRPGQLQEVREVDRCMQAELSVIVDRLAPVERLALFDMDGVLLDGRYVALLACETNRRPAVAALLDREDILPADRTRQIAAALADLPLAACERVARTAPLVPGASETVVALRKAGYRVGIVSDSFRTATEIVRRRVFADFSVAHLLRFRRGVATGEVQLAPAMQHPHGCPHHAVCKRNVLQHLTERFRIEPAGVLAVGDGAGDACLLRAVGRGVAFRPKCDAVRRVARHVVEGDLSDVLPLALDAHGGERGDNQAHGGSAAASESGDSR
jgi:phosphoserine phosphatase